MRYLKLFEDKKNISVDDLLSYVELKKIIHISAIKYFEYHKNELDEEYFNIDNMTVDHVYINENKVIIEVRDKYADITTDFELELTDFVEFCNDSDAYMAAKKYNL